MKLYGRDSVRRREVCVVRGDCDDVKMRGIEERMVGEVEKMSLRLQVDTLRRVSLLLNKPSI